MSAITISSIQSFTDAEYAALLAACKAVPPARANYRITDFVDNLQLTVLDFQMHTTTVERAMQRFDANTRKDARDLAGLKALLAQYSDDKVGNTALAQRLWRYNHWKRADMLRKLVTFFESEGITSQEALEAWALNAEFKTHFQGRIHGMGFAVFKWLTIRAGAQTVKPDVHVRRFVETTIGRRVTACVVVEVLVRAAKDLGIPAHELDWGIWEAGRKKSGKQSKTA